MRRFTVAALGVTFASLAAMTFTAGTALGVPIRDYNVSFAVLVVATALAWPVLRRRRGASMVILYTAILATVTGFLLLYLKQDFKDAGLKDWMKWWHSVTSVAFMLAFLVHWFHNNTRLWDFTARLTTRYRALGFPLIAVWVLAFVAGAATWTAVGKARFTEANYLLLSGWAVLGGVVFVYGGWLATRWPRLRARLADPDTRNRVRAVVDTSLFVAAWLSLLTGFALLYFKDFLHGNGFKYVSKWWHTSTSVAWLAFVTIHIGFNARLVAAHARTVDNDLAAKRGGGPDTERARS